MRSLGRSHVIQRADHPKLPDRRPVVQERRLDRIASAPVVQQEVAGGISGAVVCHVLVFLYESVTKRLKRQPFNAGVRIFCT